MTKRINPSITVVDFLVEKIIENFEGTIGTSNFITPYALRIGSTFEYARDLVYTSIDKGEIEMTPSFHLKLSRKTLENISKKDDTLILAFFRKAVEKKGLQRLDLQDAVNFYRNSVDDSHANVENMVKKLEKAGKIGETDESYFLLLDGETPAAQIRNQEITDKVLILTSSFEHGNYVDASNRIYDLIKKRLPLARTVILKKFGKHDETSKKATWKKSKADISGSLRHGNAWLSDLGEASQERIVQHRGMTALAWNKDETKRFDVDIRMLVMDEGEFIREVRRMCDESKEFNKRITAIDIQSHINIAENHLAYLRKIEKDFKNGYPTRKF